MTFAPGPDWKAFVLQPSKLGVRVYAWRELADPNLPVLHGCVVAFTTSIESARATLPTDAKQSHGRLSKSLPKECELWIR